MTEALLTADPPSTPRRRPGTDRRWTARAFGLDLDLGFPVPGLSPAESGSGAPDSTRVDLAYADSIDAAWPRDGARRAGIMGPPDRPVMEVDEHITAGYRIVLRPYGRYLVSADGREVWCAPPAVGWWYWQRLLIGQVLPAAAAVRELELLHASAVTIDNRAIAFAGPPGFGKSSLALRLMLRGHQLLAEDVLALRVRDGELVAEPGASMLNVREDEFDGLDADRRTAVGQTVGHSHGKVHVIAARDDRTLPLAALYLLTGGETDQPTFERLTGVGAPEILSNSFVVYVHRTGRMIRQLDIASLIARTVPVVRLRVQPGIGADQLAAMVEQHAEGLR